MSHAAVFILTLIGFGALLIAMPRHQSDWLRRRLETRLSVGLRVAGFIVLLSATVVAVRGLGIGYGLVAWCGWLTGAALIWVAANAMFTGKIRS